MGHSGLGEGVSSPSTFGSSFHIDNGEVWVGVDVGERECLRLFKHFHKHLEKLHQSSLINKKKKLNTQMPRQKKHSEHSSEKTLSN